MHPYTQDIEPTATPSGEFTDGDPIAGLSPTVLRSAWPNMMQRELLNVLAAANITPDKQQFSQLLAAIQKLDYPQRSKQLAVLDAAEVPHDDADTSLLLVAIQKLIANAQTAAKKESIGNIFQGPYTSAPQGCLSLVGGTYARSTYADLWSFIEGHYKLVNDSQRADYPGAFTSGNGSTTFRVPDLRGLFLRGVGGQALGLGRLQTDAIRNIKGRLGTVAYPDWGERTAIDGAFKNDGQNGTSDTDGGGPGNLRISFDASRVVPTALENRPANTAWPWFIRAN